MVAGAACMVGPTAVALLAKYTPLNYTSMAWVGTGFYLLHFPAIFIALAGGARLSALQKGHSGKPRDDEAGITEPLLDPGAPASSTPTLIRYSSRQSADGSSRHSSTPLPPLQL
ncbi:MFS domain-containing protein [Haematococcus lacustris]|uniref:MFS domain-containing protein n=1 Tax=Haematococcus lacustris TaxID=44745 RepID=A0A6A0AKG6_HAELA|nr:MFS domain-containing protein [Haematococcus lacustris]